jgi:hypothetical protein
VISQDNGSRPDCIVCKKEIEFEPYRMISLVDKSGIPSVLHFHYFSPCWDLNRFFYEHMDDQIISLAYSCDESILERPKIIRNMRNNLDLWL